MFDLNINHYNNNELLDLFAIDKNKLYDIIEINSKYELLVGNIQKSKKSNEEKMKTCNFLEEVKNKLIINLSNKVNPERINTLTTAINQNTSQINPLQTASSSKSKNLFVEKVITIDTRFRENYKLNNGTSFSYTIQQPVNNVLKMDLISVEIPQVNCIMSSNYNNSSFMIRIDSEEFIIELPNIYLMDNNFNNYTKLIDLCNYYLKNHLNKIISRCYFLLPQYDEDITVLRHILFVFDQEGLSEDEIPETIELNFEKTGSKDGDNRDLRSKLGWMLGFRQPRVVLQSDSKLEEIINKDFLLKFTNFVKKRAIRAEVAIQITSAKYIYLVIDDFNSNKIENFIADEITLRGCDTSVSLGGNILAKILFDSGSRFYTVDRLVTIKRQYTGPVDIHKLKISLIDEFGRILDLNNIDWSFSIKLSSN